jgi:hypothetical protein
MGMGSPQGVMKHVEMAVDATQAPPARRPASVFRLLAPAIWVLAVAWVTTAAWRLTPDPNWWLPLLSGSGIAAILVWRMGWHDAWTRYLGFGALVLLACALNRTLYILDFVIDGGTYHQWPFYAANEAGAIIKAEVATVVGTLLTVAAWWRCGGANYSPGLLLDVSRNWLIRLLTVTYGASLLAIAALSWVPELYAWSGQLLPTTLVLGATTAFFLPLLMARHKAVRLCITVLMGLPFVYVALGTGMKENILLALVPTAYLLWNYSSRRIARFGLVIAALLAAGLITSYISYFRDEVWYADRAIDQTLVMDEYLQSVSDKGLPATVTQGMDSFLSRNNAVPPRGWAIVIADTEGHRPGLVFSPLAHVFIPRMLWPGKPDIRQGWEYSGLVFGDHYMAWSDSSLSAGLYPALYLGGGWAAVALGAVAIGLIMALSTRMAFRMGGPALVGLFTLSMLPYAMRLDEAWTVGAFSAPIINLIYISVVYLAARVVAGILGLRRTPT